MPKDSTEIKADNVVKRYMRRQEVLEDFHIESTTHGIK